MSDHDDDLAFTRALFADDQTDTDTNTNTEPPADNPDPKDGNHVPRAATGHGMVDVDEREALDALFGNQ